MNFDNFDGIKFSIPIPKLLVIANRLGIWVSCEKDLAANCWVTGTIADSENRQMKCLHNNSLFIVLLLYVVQ